MELSKGSTTNNENSEQADSRNDSTTVSNTDHNSHIGKSGKKITWSISELKDLASEASTHQIQADEPSYHFPPQNKWNKDHCNNNSVLIPSDAYEFEEGEDI